MAENCKHRDDNEPKKTVQVYQSTPLLLLPYRKKSSPFQVGWLAAIVPLSLLDTKNPEKAMRQNTQSVLYDPECLCYNPVPSQSSIYSDLWLLSCENLGWATHLRSFLLKLNDKKGIVRSSNTTGLGWNAIYWYIIWDIEIHCTYWYLFLFKQYDNNDSILHMILLFPISLQVVNAHCLYQEFK